MPVIDLYEQRKADAFALMRSELTMRATLKNLLRAASEPTTYALPAQRPQDLDGAAIVVGAGPDLAVRMGWLKELAEDGHAPTIIAVNAAMPGLARAGVPVDVLVCREALDQSHHLECGGFKRAVFDMAVNERIVEAAKKHGAEIEFFVAAGSQYWSLANALHCRPLYAGTAALTAAVSYAYELGAQEIVLVGVDLALYAGHAYSHLSAYGKVDVEVKEGMIQLSNTTELRRGAVQAGVQPSTDRQHEQRVKCWDGEERSTLGEWVDQIKWLSDFGQSSWEKNLLLVDTCTQGAVKVGWQSGMPHYPHGRLSNHGKQRIDQERVLAFLEQLVMDATWLEEAAVSPRLILGRPPRITTNFIETMAARALTISRDLGVVDQKLSACYGGLREAAEWTRKEILAWRSSASSSA